MNRAGKVERRNKRERKSEVLYRAKAEESKDPGEESKDPGEESGRG